MVTRPLTRAMPDRVPGAAHGVGLACLGTVAAGGGHGTYVPLGASSAPFGLLGITGALVGAPVLYWGLRALAEHTPPALGRPLLLAVVGVHYGSAAWLLTRAPFGDWEYLTRSAALSAIAFAWLVVYARGQVGVWRHLVGAGRAPGA